MKAKHLMRHFSEYTAKAVRPEIGEGETVAILFGTDQVKVDFKAKTIEIKGLAAMPYVETFSPLNFDWAAIYRQDNTGWKVYLGTGNPYGVGMEEVLPARDGHIRAVPSQAYPLSEGGFLSALVRRRTIGES